MFKKCGKIMEKHVGQSSALQEIDRWSSCKFSTAGKHSVLSISQVDHSSEYRRGIVVSLVNFGTRQ